MNELLEVYDMTRVLFERFEFVKKCLEETVKKQKLSYKTGAVYISLHYCSKKGCLYCPHHFEFRQRLTNVENQKKGTRYRSIRLASKRITHRDLWKIEKDYLYPMLKKMESELRPLQEERDELAARIRRIITLLRNFDIKNDKRIIEEQKK
ncbi:MAG: hypothetical protein AB7E48_09905 [Deferribacterales bacterium]